jgi:KaiC/GvpD/RAD55 family RecA-like ATPase
MSDRLETGIPALDRKLDGGLPPGSIVVLNAPPASQSEQVIRDLAAARKTLVVTTRRPRASVERSLDRRGLSPETVAVREVDPEESTDHVFTCVRALDDRTNLVIDPVDPIEQLPERRYVDFLSRLQTHVREKDSLAVLHSLKSNATVANRGVTEYMSDVVFELTTDVNGDNIENRLVVPKFRDGHPFKEVLKLELRNKVAVDTSRDIG